MGELTEDKKKEYDRLVAHMEQMQLQLDKLMEGPTIYGYARVSTPGQARNGTSLEDRRADCRLPAQKKSIRMFLRAGK